MKQTSISSLFSLGKRNRLEITSPKKGQTEEKRKKRQKLEKKEKSEESEDSEEFVPVLRQVALDDDDFELNDLVPEDPMETLARSPSPPRIRTPVTSPKRKIRVKKPSIASPRKKRGPKKAAKEENRYEWLETIRDANKRLPNDPLYDPRSLYIPESAFDKLSAFEGQFWRVKQKHFDTVVFFKKGKFYELYEMDADVGKKEFDLKMTDRVNMRMVGVPESSVHQWAAKFLARGYKITQVDQVESSIAMNRRVKSTKTKQKAEKVIRREVTRILTQGTLQDEEFIGDFKSHYLVSVKERINATVTSDKSNFVSFGLCIVDCSVGKITFANFNDDSERTQLQTILIQCQPKEFIFEKGIISQKTVGIINNRLNFPGCNYLPSGSEFLSSSDAIKRLKEMLHSDQVPSIVEQQPDMNLSAMGGCLTYLNELKIGNLLLPNCTFGEWDSTKNDGALTVDGQAIIQLEVLQNNVDHSDSGSLFRYMDHCSTKFGQRLLRTWICNPLQDTIEIERRLDAIDWFATHGTYLEKLQRVFKMLPDMERAVSRLQSASQTKVSHLVEVLEGLLKISTLIDSFNITEGEIAKESILYDLLLPSKEHVTFQSTLNQFSNSFDLQAAKQDKFIVPKEGVDKVYDAAAKKEEEIKETLEKHLKRLRRELNVPIKFTHMQKEKYQLEISCSQLASCSIPDDFQLVSKTNAVKRFYDSFVQETLKTLADTQEDFNIAKENVFQHYLDLFRESASLWTSCISRMAQLDVLCSLTITSTKSGSTMCRPSFVDAKHGTYFDIRDMRHPMLCMKFQDHFISNSISMGTKDDPSRVMLLTGPNMGGKSTLLRQICLLVIMGQVGCYVPASRFTFAPVDRIFTRLGASDDILMGQSTFMVELQETSTILEHVTDNSLVILDELGRGTSTFDGYSIAYATLAHLSLKTKAAILFSTHYHSLTEEYKDDANTKLYHMACLVDESEREVVFLYKLQEGVCPSSYGMNVALAAGLPKSIVNRACEIAEKFKNKK